MGESRDALNEWLDRTEELVSPEVFTRMMAAAVDRLFANPSSTDAETEHIGIDEAGCHILWDDMFPSDTVLDQDRIGTGERSSREISVGRPWAANNASLNRAAEDARLNPVNERIGPPTTISGAAIIGMLLGRRCSEYNPTDHTTRCLLYGGPAHGQMVPGNGSDPWIDVVTPTPVDFTWSGPSDDLPLPITLMTVRYTKATFSFRQETMETYPQLNRWLFTWHPDTFGWILNFYAHNVTGITTELNDLTARPDTNGA